MLHYQLAITAEVKGEQELMYIARISTIQPLRTHKQVTLETIDSPLASHHKGLEQKGKNGARCLNKGSEGVG